MSNPEAMQKLTDRFMNDPGFREQMRQDPGERPSTPAWSSTRRTGGRCAASTGASPTSGSRSG